ncbi:MAG: WbqC family protein [Gaiellaceae bacterium]
MTLVEGANNTTRLDADSDVDGKRVAIVQSCYIPWKGYFDLINLVDEFILFDDRQFTRRDWRNRNRIKTAQGVQWLTIPVVTKGRYSQRVDETVVSDPAWAEKHWRTLVHNYAAAPHFEDYRDVFESLYGSFDKLRLSSINRSLLEAVCSLLGIATTLTWSTDYASMGDRSERLLSLCRQAGASSYVSGPRAKEYLDERIFADGGIEVQYIDYDGYPEYPQLHGSFEHTVTVIDLLFNVGSDAPKYMKSFAA